MKKLKYIIILFSIIINNSCTEKINYTGKILNDDKLGYQNLQCYFESNKNHKNNNLIKKKFLTELVRCDTQKNKR